MSSFVVVCCTTYIQWKNSNVNALIAQLEIENAIDQNANVGEARGEQWIQVDVAIHHDFEQVGLQVGEQLGNEPQTIIKQYQETEDVIIEENELLQFYCIT